jgi:very-short-patch-repair endonuclease
METGGHVKRLRKNMTDAERKLWTHLRDRQIASVKFRRQHPIGPYVVDFIALEPKLIIEIDGGHHARQVEQDAKRSEWLVSNGFRVLRFWNHEVLQHTDKVLQAIERFLSLEGRGQGESVPSPFMGEG